MRKEIRPLFHFTPLKNWMNDPNGLVYHNGEYHLFYQHNPYGKDWGNMSWGHAASNDLLHWQHLPVALTEEPQNNFTIFSGSAVVDVNNSSGFGNPKGVGQPPIIAVYTADYHPKKELQNIHIAYSVDSGRKFTKYSGNPVLDEGDQKFGDPKVFWHSDTAKWIMVNILGEKQGRVVLYNSSDLKKWRHMSEFTAEDKVPGKWECPDLFPLAVDDDPKNVKWILKVNSTTGSVSKYFIGGFDGQSYHTDPNLPEAYDLNFGDFYAESTWNNIPVEDSRRILIGWVPQSPCEGRSWTGMQSLPRILTLRSFGEELRVCQEPIPELKKLRSQSQEIKTVLLKSNAKLSLPIPGNEFEIAANFEIESYAEFSFKMHFDSPVGESRHKRDRGNEVAIGYSRSSNQFFVERSGKERLAAPAMPVADQIIFHIFIDRSVIEIFINRGEIVFTFLVEPVSMIKEFFIYNKGREIQIKNLEIWKLYAAEIL